MEKSQLSAGKMTASSLGTDLRLDPRLLPFLQQHGADKRLRGTHLTPKSPPEDIEKVLAHIDAHANKFHDSTPCSLPGDETEPKVEVSELVVGKDEVALYVFRKAGIRAGELPTVVYIHGGSMVCTRTRNPTHDRWCTSLALEGVVVVAVDFRNAYTKERHNPFPAGLNDCAAAVRHLASHKEELGISNIILTGESGGGNLALATALKANREGWIDEISGVYSISPYISNIWDKPKSWLLKNNLQSIIDNDGYFTESSISTLMGHYYTPTEADKTNPLAWPYHATTEDLKGLPPHIISVGELDMLRDEGIAYVRKLQLAGVNVVGKTNLGATHAAEMFRHYVPELHYDAIGSIASFSMRMLSSTS